MTDINSRIEATKTELTSLKTETEQLLASKQDASLPGILPASSLTAIRAPPATKLRRTLKGHFGKVVDIAWAGDSQSLVSASQDGTLLLWNAVTTNKLKVIPLKSSYVMSVGMEQTQNNLVACGGLDNLCTVYKISDPGKALLEMASHDGYVSCCKFVSPQKIVTASGDSTLMSWDVTSGRLLDVYSEHKHDVMQLDICPTNKNLIVSGSVDQTAKLWDLRVKNGSVQTFFGHTGDVDGVNFMANGIAFGTASEDGTARVFDLRACNQVAQFGNLLPPGETMSSQGLTSVSFSRSGRILFAGHAADGSILAWDVLGGTKMPTFTLPAHETHVSCVAVNPQGDALCSGSWDSTLKIWA